MTTVHAQRDGTVVADVMVRAPKVLPVRTSLSAVREAFADDHVVMVLLTDEARLRGTVLRQDLPPHSSPSAPALLFSRLADRTVAPTERVADVYRRLISGGLRRLAVVDADGLLLGLLCLKRRRDGFCDDAGVAARAGVGCGSVRRPDA